MKKILYLIIISLAVACANKEKKSADGGWDVTVSGKVKFPTKDGLIRIQELTPAQNAKMDSVTIKEDSTYSETLHVTEPGYYRFNFFDLQIVDLVVDKSNIELNVDGNDHSGDLEIKGSPDYDLFRYVQEQLHAFEQEPEVAQIQTEFNDAIQNNKKEKIGPLQDRYIELKAANREKIVADLEKKPVNLGLVNMLQGATLDKDHFFDFYKKVADSAVTKWPTSIHAKQFKDMVDKMAITAIGKKAPEITLPDPDGKIVKLSSFQGKYVLVDFWAKWCGPCRKENPNVVKAYNEFHPKGFEVLGVSLDRSKEDWVQAIKEDGLTWTQVSDLKYYDSQAAADYNINSIPFSILVDPNGIIVAKNLRGKALEKKLQEVFNKKS